jgi:lysophospholipase L1-like esterase
MKTSRREFIKSVGLAGVASMALPNVISASNLSSEKINTDKKGLTILFQGDSITDGNRTRDNDWNHVMGHGYAYLIASRLWYEYTDMDLMFYNRGISGNRINDLEARWQTDALDLNPNVISILIGINDVLAVVNNNNPITIEQFTDSYKRILDKTLSSNPDVHLVICEPFILHLGWVNTNYEMWKSEVEKLQISIRKIAETYKTSFVELQNPFLNACQKAQASYWIWDGVHPMPAGHELIARLWIMEMSKKLTFLKT